MAHERSGRAAKYGKLEEALMLWFNDIRSHGARVTDAMLVDKAQDTTSTISRKQTCVTDFFQKKVRLYKYYLKKSCNYIFENNKIMQLYI